MDIKMNFYWILGILLLNGARVNCYNILFVNIFGGRSHKNAMDPVAEELATRGHNVTFLSTVKETKIFSGIEEVFLPESSAAYAAYSFNFFEGKINEAHINKKYYDLLLTLIDVTYRLEFVRDLIRHPRNVDAGVPKYDVFVVDAIFNEFVLPLAHNMGVPTVYLSPSILLPHVAWSLNIPSPYSYVPSFIDLVPGRMGFFQKIRSVYHTLDFIYGRFYIYYPKEEELIRKYLPDSPSLRELEKNVSFLLTNDHFSITPRVPTMPYFVEVGGLHLKTPEKLPKDLQEFMDDSGDEGVVYFSLGSVTQGSSMPEFLRRNIVLTFARLEQKILWKNEVSVNGTSDNVKIVTWVPQNDVLAHPKLKLFISHGGGLSVQEAGHNGCPMLGIPLGADQDSNMANVINAGFGEAIDWRTLTMEEFSGKIRKILNDKKYKANAERVAKLMKDRQEHPVKTAAYWIEYVVRHKGAPHLKSGAENLDFFQYFLLDIISVVAIAVFGTLFAIAFAAKKLAIILIGRQRYEHKSKEN